MVAQKINLLAIVGPTASGKTSLSIKIAKKYRGEVISADSRAIYKFMDIGTAKPTIAERAGVPHWGFDIVGPGNVFTLADYKLYADTKISEIAARGNLPIIVGGSGLYIDAVLYDFSLAPTDQTLRDELSNKTIDELKIIIIDQKLTMPENINNKRYLIRSIERGKSMPCRKPLGKGAYVIGIKPEKAKLEQNISNRLDLMLNHDVIKEIKECADKYGWDSVAMTGGIYRSFRGYFEGTAKLEKSKRDFIRSDKALAKKQMTWLKRNPDIKWFETIADAETWIDKLFGGKLN